MTDAINKNWIVHGFDYWDNQLGWLTVCNSPYQDCDINSISSWEGVFVYSNKDNITLIRQN